MDITSLLTFCVRNKIPISFSKYGDGEYACANSFNGPNSFGYKNCDRDTYTEKKKHALIESFKYMADHTPNAYFSFWTNEISSYWQSLVQMDVKWGKLHTLIFEDDSINEKVELYKTIKSSPLKKIYVCNPLMVKARILLNIDWMFFIPFDNWFDTLFEELIKNMVKIINPDEQYVIMLSAGMASKCVISELHKLYPNNIYLDIGSALDTICTKRITRDSDRTYEKALYYLHELIPPEWDDPSYDVIYSDAAKILGTHLRSNYI